MTSGANSFRMPGRRSRRRFRRARIRRQPRPPHRHRSDARRSRPTTRHVAAALPRLIGDYARKHPDGPIWAHGWDESGWPEPAAPSTDDLDGVVGDRPAYLARVDVHSAAASTALRCIAPRLAEAAGFDPQRPLTSDAHHLVRAAARDKLTSAAAPSRSPGRPRRRCGTRNRRRPRVCGTRHRRP